MTVEESWEKIERWIAQHAPEEDPLPAPCTRADLERLYESVGGLQARWSVRGEEGCATVGRLGRTVVAD